MITRALFFDAPRKVSIRDVTLAAPTAGEVLVRGLASAISQGTELLLYRGEGPEPFDPSLPAAASYPRRYGYAWVGSIVERGVGPLPDEGTRVFALAPHGAAHILAGRDVRPIRSDIPPHRAAIAANLETALTCVWDASASIGESAVVLGGGLIGILIAWLLDRTGAKVTLIDPRIGRRACASSLVPRAEVLEAAEAKHHARADVVVEATGNPAALDAAIQCAAQEARVVVASFYGRRRAPVDLGDAFHRRRLTLVASQVSSIPARLLSRFNTERRFGIVEDLLGEPNLDGLIAKPVPFEEAPNLYAKLDSGDAETLPCHVFGY
jgi:2-desacetyl-2-hydroxyethyl bacteriochlorophyllide A dehydrogenase